MSSACSLITLDARKYALERTLTIEKAITIVGNGATLDAGARDRVINMCGARVHLQQLTIANGYSQQEGGGIATANLLTCKASYVRMIDCNVTNNSAIQGGGIHVRIGTRLEATGCRFVGNEARDRGGGGMVLEQDVHANLENCTFADNHARMADAIADFGWANGGGLQAFAPVGINLTGSCEFVGNSADNGGAIYIVGEGATLHAHGTHVHANIALGVSGLSSSVSGGIWSSGAVYLYGALVHGNLRGSGADGNLCATPTRCSAPSPANLFNNGNLSYVLPAPLGFHVDGVFRCGESTCSDPVTNDPVPCALQACNVSLLKGAQLSRLREGLITEDVPTPCAPGFYAASTEAGAQRTALCSDLCPSGHFCALSPTTQPQPCPEGTYFAGRGATSRRECTLCTVGHYCTPPCSTPQPCAPGYDGSGRCHGPPSCAGPCPVAHYCPTNATSPFVCPPGTTRSTKGARAATDCVDCASGYWCNAGRAFPCPPGSFAGANRSSSPDACTRCDEHSTTLANASSSIDDCICIAGYLDDLGRAAVGSRRRCTPCPIDGGFACFEEADGRGLDTRSVGVAGGFWRPDSACTVAKRCPAASACVGGRTPDSFSPADGSGCAEGLVGPYCTECADASYYSSRGTCQNCTASYVTLPIILLCVLLALVARTSACRTALRQAGSLAASGVRRLRRRVGQRRWRGGNIQAQTPLLVEDVSSSPASDTAYEVTSTRRCATVAVAAWRLARRLARVDWQRHTLDVKLKILVSFTLVTAQIGDVYQVRYPAGYQTLTDALFGIFRGLELSHWLPGLSFRCVAASKWLKGIGLNSLAAELIVGSALPLLLMAGRVAGCWFCTRTGTCDDGTPQTEPWEVRLAPALPFVLWVSYLAYPVMVSMGFQALGACDCFERYDDAPALCFLPARYSVICSASGRAPQPLFSIAITVVVFWILVRFGLYGWLLWYCRDAIASSDLNERGALARSLHVLHGPYVPAFKCVWPLVDGFCALVLVGLLALLSPGSLLQLLAGLLASVRGPFFSCLKPHLHPSKTHLPCPSSRCFI